MRVRKPRWDIACAAQLVYDFKKFHKKLFIINIFGKMS